MRTSVTLTTLGLGLSLAATATLSPAAPKMTHKVAAKPANAAMIAHGKMVSNSNRCNTCHGADLTGKKGFSPSLHASGALREYTPKTFARVMDTGVTEDGGHVRPPMPVYHMKTKDSTALYAYFKTLK